MDNNKCDAHDTKIEEIRTEFSQYKIESKLKFENIYTILEEIKDKIKPQFTTPQITTFLTTVLGFMVTVMLFVGTMKSDIRQNKTISEFNTKASEKTDLQYQNIISTLNNNNTSTQAQISKLERELAEVRALMKNNK